MILFDKSVIIDARDARSPWHPWAKEQIASAVTDQGAVANTVTVSEAILRDRLHHIVLAAAVFVQPGAPLSLLCLFRLLAAITSGSAPRTRG